MATAASQIEQQRFRQERDRFEALSPYEQASRLFAVASGAAVQARQRRA